MGRSLLNVPHEVLLDQVVELREHLGIADRTRAALGLVGLDGPALLAELTAAVPAARDQQSALALAKVEQARMVDERAGWRQTATLWVSAVRRRLDLLGRPDQLAAVPVVRAALPREASRRYAGTLRAITDTLSLLEVHANVLGVAGWQPDLVAQGRGLVTDGAALDAASAAADARAAAAAAAVARSRTALQDLVRRTRLAVELARASDPSVPPLPLGPLERYAETVRAARAAGTRGMADSESVPATSESVPATRESGADASECAPATSESLADTRDSGTATSEFGTATSESSTATNRTGRLAVVDSRAALLDLSVAVVDSRVAVTERLVSVSDSLLSAADSLVAVAASPVAVAGSRSAEGEGR